MKLTPQAPFEPALRQIIGHIRDCGVKHYLSAHGVDVGKAEAAHEDLPQDQQEGTKDLFLMAIALGQHVLDETDSPTAAVRKLRLVDADVEEPWTDLPTELDQATGDQAFVRGLTHAGIEKLIARILSTKELLLMDEARRDASELDFEEAPDNQAMLDAFEHHFEEPDSQAMHAMLESFERGFEQTKFDHDSQEPDNQAIHEAFELGSKYRTKFDILVEVFRCGFTYGTRLRIDAKQYAPVVRDSQPRWLWLTCGWDKGQEPERFPVKFHWALERLAVQLAVLETSGTRDIQWWPVVSDARPGDIVVVQLRPFDTELASKIPGWFETLVKNLPPDEEAKKNKKYMSQCFFEFNPAGCFCEATASAKNDQSLLENDAPLGLAVVTSPARSSPVPSSPVRSSPVRWKANAWRARVGSFIELPRFAREHLNESDLGKDRKDKGGATMATNERQFRVEGEKEEKLLPELTEQQILELKTTLLSTSAETTKSNLIGANLTGRNFTDANFTNAILNGANLTGANLTNAILNGANLTDANLTNAILNGANLTDANLTNAILNGAKLEGAKLVGAVFSPPIRAILSSLAILSQNLSESHPLPDCYMVAPSYNDVSECAFFLATGPSELDLGTHPLKILDALPRKGGNSKFIIKVPYCPDLFLEFTPEMPLLPPGKASESFLKLPLDPLGRASTDVYIVDGNEKLMALVTNASGVDDAVALFAIRKAILECRSSQWPRWQSDDEDEKWRKFRKWLRRAGYYGSTG